MTTKALRSPSTQLPAFGAFLGKKVGGSGDSGPRALLQLLAFHCFKEHFGFRTQPLRGFRNSCKLTHRIVNLAKEEPFPESRHAGLWTLASVSGSLPGKHIRELDSASLKLTGKTFIFQLNSRAARFVQSPRGQERKERERWRSAVLQQGSLSRAGLADCPRDLEATMFKPVCGARAS